MSQEPTVQKENQQQKDAFQYYFQMGGERSYVKVATKFKVAISTVERWGKVYKWQDRVQKLEADVRSKMLEQQVVEKELDYRQRNLRIIKRGILEHAKAINVGQLKPSYKHLMDLVRLEEEIRTGISSRSEVNHTIQLKGLTNDEISEKTNKILEEIKRLKGMRKINGEIIDADFKEVENQNISSN